jgi:hypothetical protein
MIPTNDGTVSNKQIPSVHQRQRFVGGLALKRSIKNAPIKNNDRISGQMTPVFMNACGIRTVTSS